MQEVTRIKVKDAQASRLQKYAPISALAAGIIWGTIGIVGKTLLNANYDALQIITVRLIVAAIVGQAVMFIVNKRLTMPSLPFWFALHGIIGVALAQILYFQGLDRLGVALTVTLHYIWPGLSVLLGKIFFGETLTFWKIVAVFLSIFGVALVSGVGFESQIIIDGLGAASVFLSALAVAVSNALSKYELQRSNSLEVTVWPITFAAIFLVLWANFQGVSFAEFASLEHKLSVAYLGVMPTLLSAALFTMALKGLPIGTASILATVEPIIGVTFAALLFGEWLVLPQYLGLALILGAVATVNVRHKS